MVVMTRANPELNGRATTMNVQEADVSKMQKRGWIVAESVKTPLNEPVKTEVVEEVKVETVVADEPKMAVEQKTEKKRSQNRREV